MGRVALWKVGTEGAGPSTPPADGEKVAGRSKGETGQQHSFAGYESVEWGGSVGGGGGGGSGGGGGGGAGRGLLDGNPPGAETPVKAGRVNVGLAEGTPVRGTPHDRSSNHGAHHPGAQRAQQGGVRGVGEGGGGEEMGQRSVATSIASDDWCGNGENTTVKSMFNFRAEREYEMSLVKGEIIVVVRKHGSGWWEGCSVVGAKRGWFPSNHVVAVDVGAMVAVEAGRSTANVSVEAGQSAGNVPHGAGLGAKSSSPLPNDGQNGVGSGVAAPERGEGGGGDGGHHTNVAKSAQSLSLVSTVHNGNNGRQGGVASVQPSSESVGSSLGGVEGLSVDGVCAFLCSIDLGEYAQGQTLSPKP